MQLQRIETPGIAHYAYVLADGVEAAVIDPRRDAAEYLGIAAAMGARITHIVETHRQEDFVMGSQWLARHTDAKIVNGTHSCFGRGDLRLEDSEHFKLGGLRIEALHTPGHTPESMCYAVYARDEKIPWCVFTGDTLFFGETGRTDLPDETSAQENAATLYRSVHEKLAPLGDTPLVLPAHGPGSVCGSGMQDRPMSTLGEEKRYNPVFTHGCDDFSRTKAAENLPRPPYFRHMEKVNLAGGMEPQVTDGGPQLLAVDAFVEATARGKIFDLREPEAFAGGHISGSYSLWLGGVPAFGGWISDGETPVYLVGDGGDDVKIALQHLGRIGIDCVSGALAGGFGSWRSSGKAIASSGTVSVDGLHDRLGEFQILDVREAGEFDAGHIEGAEHAYVGDLEQTISELSLHRDEPVVVMCSVGHRASLAVSILLRNGYEQVHNLLGGMLAWQAAGHPIVDGDD